MATRRRCHTAVTQTSAAPRPIFAPGDLKDIYNNYAKPGSRLSFSLLHGILDQEPDNAHFWRRLADAYFKKENYKEAAKCLRRSCVARGRKPHDYRRYALCKFHLGKRKFSIKFARLYYANFGHSDVISKIIFSIAREQLSKKRHLDGRTKRTIEFYCRHDWNAHSHALNLVRDHLDCRRPDNLPNAFKMLSYLKSCSSWPLIEAFTYRYFEQFDKARNVVTSIIRDAKTVHPAVLRLAVEVCHIHGKIGADEDIFKVALERLERNDPHRLRAQLAMETIGYYKNTLEPGDELSVPEICFASAPRYSSNIVRGASNRIALFGGSLAAGGAEKILALLFKEIIQSHSLDSCDLFICDLYSSPNQRHFMDLISDLGCNIYQLPKPSEHHTPLSYLPGALGQRSMAIANVLRDGRYATAYFSLDHLILAGGLAALHCEVPNIILHTHNMAPTALDQTKSETSGWKEAYHYLLRHRQTKLVACCAAAAKDYSNWANIPLRSIAVVRNGMEFPNKLTYLESAKVRRLYNIPRSPLVVGSAFRFDQVKQPMLWIEAARSILVHQPKAHFVIFGDGPLKKKVESRISELGLQSKFSLPGNIKNAPPHFALFDAFVLTSRSEALPNTIVEAQAYGVPVFSFDVGGVAEAIVDGRSGQVTPPQQVEALATSVVSRMAEQRWVRNAGRLARQNSRGNFGIERMFADMRPLLGI
jgi:glycosyltransferase involved in cell wall biosynthesis